MNSLPQWQTFSSLSLALILCMLHVKKSRKRRRGILQEWALMKARSSALFFEKSAMVAVFPASFSERIRIATIDDFSKNVNFLFSAIALSLGLEVVVFQLLGAEAIIGDTFRTLLNYISFLFAGVLCYYLMRLMGQPAFGLPIFIQFYAYALAVPLLLNGVFRSFLALTLLQNPIAVKDSPISAFLLENKVDLSSFCEKLKSLECQMVLKFNIYGLIYFIGVHLLIALTIIVLAKMLARRFQVPVRTTVAAYIISFLGGSIIFSQLIFNKYIFDSVRQWIGF